jgi:hypothetical protein
MYPTSVPRARRDGRHAEVDNESGAETLAQDALAEVSSARSWCGDYEMLLVGFSGVSDIIESL